MYSIDLYGSNIFYLFSVERHVPVSICILSNTSYIIYYCQLFWFVLVSYKLFSYRPVLLLSGVIKGSIHKVTEPPAPMDPLPWRVHFQHRQCLHRIRFELGHMLGRRLSAGVSFEVEDIPKLMRILSELTLRSYILASLSTNKLEFCLHDKTQLSPISQTCLICKPRERVRRAIAYKSPQSTRDVDLKGKPKQFIISGSRNAHID